MELKQITNVSFYEDTHKYLNSDFEELSGITAIIKKCICPDLYKDVDEATLAKAARHGTLCHKLCEAFDNGELDIQDDGNYTALNEIFVYNSDHAKDVLVQEGGYIADPELHAYIAELKKHKLNIEASEYLVTDGKHFASCIDKVIRESDDTFSILDLKFTYAYHEEPVTWQTSFYADMLEAQNPGAKVKNLYCLHIHYYKDGTCKSQLHKLKRIKSDILEECKRCFLHDLAFDNPLAKKQYDETQATAISIEYNGETLSENDIAIFMQNAKKIEDKKKAIMDSYKEWFRNNPNYNKITNGTFSVSQSVSVASEVLDTAKLKELYPDIYNECITYRTAAPRTTFKINKK